MNDISERKNDHLDFVLSNNKEWHSCFDDYKLEYNALPEIDFEKIDTSTKFLGRMLKLPLVISSISGGTERSKKLNYYLAEVAQDFGIGMCVGSQRIALDNPSVECTFKVRNYAPDILVLANFGAVQLNYGYTEDECVRAVEMIDADGLLLHLNPLQEAFQNNGNTNFEGLLPKLEKIKKKISVPLIIKEVGHGISFSVAKRLFNAGIDIIDVAGLGSISWAEVEGARSNDIVYQMASSTFKDWGISTIDSLIDIASRLPDLSLIASGGLRNGVDVAKSIAAGARVCGMATAILKKLTESRSDCENFLEALSMELRVAMFCTGCKNIKELRSAKMVRVS